MSVIPASPVQRSLLCKRLERVPCLPPCLELAGTAAVRGGREGRKTRAGIGERRAERWKVQPQNRQMGSEGGRGGTRPFSAACAHPERRMAMP